MKQDSSRFAGADALSIAYFISPHGFGHAARASAVIEAVRATRPETYFHLFTSVPEWFFRKSLGAHWRYHPVRCDIGLVQKTALQEDVEATLDQLRGFIPFDEAVIDRLAGEVLALGCRMVICDIAPLGLAVASRAGLPSVLIENFTWDWIYAGYPSRKDEFLPFIDELERVFHTAGRHIRTEPCCEATPADLVTAPVSRSPRAGCAQTRRALGLSMDQKVILISMGGIPDRLDVAALQKACPAAVFVVPGASDAEERVENLILLPHHHAYFHPDLVAASDAVIGKVGYSTIGEVYWAGVPFAFISRQDFRESALLADYIRAHIPGFELTQSEFESGGWQERAAELLDYPRVERAGENGAGQIANYLAGLKLQ